MSIRTIDGLPIRNAKRDMVITVSARDISISKKKDHGHCVLAEAIRRHENAADVKVYLSRTFVRFKGSNEYLRYETPKSLYREIIAFDRGGSFEPGTYELLKPSKWVLRRKPAGQASERPLKKKIKPRRLTANVRSAAN